MTSSKQIRNLKAEILVRFLASLFLPCSNVDIKGDLLIAIYSIASLLFSKRTGINSLMNKNNFHTIKAMVTGCVALNFEGI